MPARNIYKPREGGHLQNDINHTNPMSLASCHLHRTSSAINGFADDMAAIPDVAKSSFLLKKGLKNSELVGNSDCISNLAKSCNQCGMVLKKEKTGLPVMNCDKQQINVNSKKAEFLVGEIDSDTEQSVADEAPSLVASGVKSRVLFFESKQEVPFGQKVRLSKSMPSLLDESLSKEVEIPVVETEMAPVVEKGADFLHQAEAYQTKIKPAKTNTQTVCTETSPPDQAKSSSLPVKEASILAECTSTPTWSSLYGAEEQQGGMSAGCPFSGKTQLKTVRLKNYVKDSQQNDTLHMKSKETHCTGSRCMGSLMQPYGGGESRPHGVPRPKEEVKEQAILFLREYYAYLKRQDSDDHQKRVKEVLEEVERTGTYELYYDELTFGAKLAWRNASRCIGRIQWNNLKVFDFRSLSTVDEIFDAICEHLEYATNMGNLRSTISIFRERRAEMKDLRIWNSQLIRYAGYEQPDGSVIGDPASVDFTKLCMKLGWKGYGGRFDVLPLLIEVAGEAPRVYEIPKHLVLEVKIKHPEYSWFEELGLQWYALPAVANMKLDIGGVEFPFSPFNGWYMVTEVGARDLGDTARYNMLEPIAKKMNLDTRTPASLWKDRAVTELNQAVLYSFQEAKVTLVDHHTASDSFIKHMENEQKLRGGCPADWVWIVPPSNGSTTEVFHQEMLNYTLKPSYDYQDDAWRHYQFEDEIGLKKLTFKQAVILVKITKILMNDVMMKRKKATVLYATETGKSETFAKTLANLLSRVFDVRIFCMNEYEFDDINKESLLVIVTSTFGNGESPMNGEDFSDKLYKLGKKYASSSGENGLGMNSKLLTSLRFAVFGLGSSAYPNFCAFAHFCRSVLKDLGAKEIHEIGEGDELSGQEDSFKNWAKGAFEASCDAFSIDQSKLSLASDVTNIEKIFDPSSYGFDYEDSQPLDLLSGLSTLHSKELHVVKVLSVKELQAKSSSRSTILVELDKEANESMSFEPGDHIAIYPSNDSEIVDRLIDLLHDAPQPDRPLRIKNISDSSTAWEAVHRLPQHSSLRQALTHFIDITNPPSQEVLRSLAKLATNEDDIKALENLSKDKKAYEEWKIENFPTIIDIAEDFPSLKLNGIDLLMLLPVLQCRYYSISSSPLMYPNQIHTTVAVVRYETQGKTKRVHNGVCSYWMSNLKRGDCVPCYIRKAANFRMPKDPKAPVIMIGPGTGIAPLRSFWQHRQVQRDMEEKSGTDWGSMDLYAGCRRFKEDNIYSEEKQQALNDGTLDHAYLALSREPKLKKTYVQDVLARHAKDVCNKLTTKQGHIYVCGDVAMAADVSRVLCEIFQDQLGFSKEKAREFLKSLKSSGHYHEDIFGVTKIPGPSRKEQN